MNTIVTDIAYDPVLFNPTGDVNTKNKRVAEEMESLFVSQLLKEMDATVARDEDSLMYSEYEGTYKSLFNQEIAREISRAGGIGIQEMVSENIARLDQGLYSTEQPTEQSTVSFVR